MITKNTRRNPMLQVQLQHFHNQTEFYIAPGLGQNVLAAASDCQGI